MITVLEKNETQRKLLKVRFYLCYIPVYSGQQELVELTNMVVRMPVLLTNRY